MSNRNNITANFLWRLFERIGAQSVTFIVSIILARLLDPEIYGTVALITVIITILQVFVDSGFSSALIQKQNPSKTDYSTVFYFNLFVCIVVYCLVFVSAPFIATFYHTSELTNLIRVSGLVIIISGVKSVQQAYVSKNLLFKKFFYSTLIGTIAAAIIGIYMAYKGYGAWALIVQNLINQLIDTVVLWFSVKWRPIYAFSWRSFKELFNYGWKILVTNLVEQFYTQLRTLIIGRKYSSADLGVYNKGNQLPVLIVTNINSAMDSILFTVISDNQDNLERVKAITRRAIRVSCFVIMPCLFGLSAVAKQFVVCVYTDKWLPSVIYLQIFCIMYLFFPVQQANYNSIRSIGRSDIVLKVEIINKIIGVISIFIFMKLGVIWIAISMLISYWIGQVIVAAANGRLINYRFSEQIADIMPSLVISAIMGGLVYLVGGLKLSTILILIVQICVGVLSYFVLARITKNESLDYLLSSIKGLLIKTSKNKSY